MNCDQLANPRKRAICRGETVVSAARRQAYLARWKQNGLLDADQFTVPENKAGTPASDWSEPTRCQHLGEVLDERECKLCGLKGKMYTVRACAIHGECSERKRDNKLENCLACDEYEPLEPLPKPPTPIVLTKPSQFPKTKPIRGFLRTGNGQAADSLQDSYRGAAVFLMCSGPSLEQMPLHLLDRPGVTVAATNNAATLHRPDLWFMVDAPGKFHEALWHDPTVKKFTRIDQATKELRTRHNGSWIWSGTFANECPSTYFFRYSAFCSYENFLDRPKPVWQVEWKDDRKRYVKRSVMLVAMRMLYWLGFRTVFLLGADFHYRPEKTYAFEGCNKASGACGTNNTTMGVLRNWFEKLRPEFERRGFRVYNCTPESRLTAFDFVEFERAIEAVAWTKPLETRGLYSGA